MAEIEIVHLPEIFVKGFAFRTNNARERTAQGWIGRTWQRARQKNIARPAAILFDYEGDNTGDYSEIIGEECNEDSSLALGEALSAAPAGRYAKFTAHGDMPGVVLEAWQMVWAAEKNGSLKRAYTADLERYPQPGTVELYIAVL